MTAAHALHRAGINFRLLEVHPRLEFDGGFNLTASAMGMRGQLAILPDIRKGSTQLTKLQRHNRGEKYTVPK